MPNCPRAPPAGPLTVRPSVKLYQAQGMLMFDLGVGVEEAMARLRAHASADGRTLGDVARDIVGGNLTLDRDDT